MHRRDAWAEEQAVPKLASLRVGLKVSKKSVQLQCNGHSV